MRLSLLFAALLFLASAVSAQELPLGLPKAKLLAAHGRPDSMVQGYNYFHYRSHGRPVRLLAIEDSHAVWYYQTSIYEPDSNRLHSIYDSMFKQVSRQWPTAISLGNRHDYQVWLSPDSLHEIVADSGRVVDIRYLRNGINIRYGSEAPEDDDYFEVAPDLRPLDSEACVVVNTWQAFLELEPYESYKYHLWARRDPWIVEYLSVPDQADFSDAYHARLTGVIKDPDLGGYILATNFIPFDTAGISEDAKIYGLSRQITYMMPEDGFWKIVSPVQYLTKDWLTKKVGNITYHFPKTHSFNDSTARAAVHYLDSISRLFDSKPLKKLDYYFCCPGYNPYSILGINVSTDVTGVAFFVNNAIFSVDTSECYNHELAHMAIHRHDTITFITEGIANYIGDDSSSFFGICKWTDDFLKAKPDFNFDSAFNIIPDNDALLTYATGSMFFHNVYKSAGIAGVVDFYKMSINATGFYRALEKYLHVSKSNADKYWRTEIARYASFYKGEDEPQKLR